MAPMGGDGSTADVPAIMTATGSGELTVRPVLW
jgi:hypothetical protein